MKLKRTQTLITGISAALILGVTSFTQAREFELAQVAQPEAVVDLAGATDGMFIVRLAEPPVATYEGGIQGLAPTSAKANGRKKLNTKSKAAKKYEAHLKKRQQDVLADASEKFDRSLSPTYTYQHAINGFAVQLSVDEAKALKSMDGVVSVQRERLEYPLTDVGPEWIGAPEIWSNGNIATQGEGMVVAVFDSGVNSDQFGLIIMIAMLDGICNGFFQRQSHREDVTHGVLMLLHQRNDLFQQVLDTNSRLGADLDRLAGVQADDVLDFLLDPFRFRGGQIDLVQDRDDFEIEVDRGVAISNTLRFHALRRVDDQQRPLAGSERTRDLVGKIHVARRVDDVQGIVLAVACRIGQ